MESARRPRTLSVVLAGGQGSRLEPLTLDRAKPAVRFAGHYSLIDFALSNLVNGGYRKIVVLTQYKSQSLHLHISRAWRLSSVLDSYVTTVPAQMRRGPHWFSGSADALYQSLHIIEDENPEYVFVFGADHIYRFDPRQFLDHHIESGADVTVAAHRVPSEGASDFGVIERGKGSKILGFHEKPSNVKPYECDKDTVLASMGNYVFKKEVLIEALKADSGMDDSRHDIGTNIVPSLVSSGGAHVYDFTSNQVPGSETDEHYWRDVGTLDAYYQANMDLVAPEPLFNMYNELWPIHTLSTNLPPAKFVRDCSTECQVSNSMISNGSIVSGGTVRNSVLSPGVRVEKNAVVEDSIILDNVHIGQGAIVRNAIIDKNSQIGPGVCLDKDLGDEQLTVSKGGVVVVGKNAELS